MAMSYPSRPTTVDDLVQRLRSDDIDQAEIEALKELSKAMISIFQDKPFLSFVPEAAALSAVVRSKDYEDLLRAFENAVTRGTMDRTVLDPEVLLGLGRVLEFAKDNAGASIPLGSVLRSLRKRLESAVEEAEGERQYQLIHAISSVLDVMNEVKTTGLDREQLHGPLLKKLSTLSKHEEIHLSQAASYAYQALLGISDSEGPWLALWRNAYTVTGGAARVAGAVFTMDPSKLLEGLETLQNIPDLINSMINVIKEVADLSNATRSTAETLKFSPKQKSWYVALRFTALLIHANALEYLKTFVLRVPCLKEKDFLCGIFAQLEGAWKAGEDSARNLILRILEEHLVPVGSKSEHGRVRAWVISIANTLHHIQWQEALEFPQQHWFSVLSKERDYKYGYCNSEMRNETHQSALLEEGWQRCTKAHVFYADLMIREYYTEGRRLKIERLSGKALPMSQCYINLAIIQHRMEWSSNEADGEQNSSPFSLFTRLKIIDPPEEIRISLPMLFSTRKQRDGIARPPKRLFIEGQAGVGKTTLCKKMVYDYIHCKMWIHLFDRLIWIPLRKLRNQLKPGYSLKDLLYNEYFFDRMDGRLFADALWRVILESSARTLFILDGLDEVAQGFDPQTGQILQNLLNQSHVIITSRPYRSSLEYMKPPDLELETIGFYADQADAYIEKALGDQAAREIQSFMQEHLLIQGLARIPIQLEAICYCWDGISASAPTTMTTLYQAIELRLWRKDAWYLTKVPTIDVAQRLTRFDITYLVQAEINLLQSLAFTGLYNDIVEFDATYCDQVLQNKDHIMEHLKCPAVTTISTVLAQLSLLRTSDTSDEGHQSYHFLHLTFQEYFAAQYYVEHWKSGKPLPYLKFRNGKAQLESILPESFLQREKYNARYDVLWRFVTGMLQCQDEDHLRRFFALIEEEPRDLLGPVHQRLAMHCLSEVDSSNNTSTSISLRENLEEHLSQWALFEYYSNGTARLAGDMQFPQSVLEAILQEGSEDRRSSFMRLLPARRTSVPSFIKFITAWLKGDVSPHMMASICKVLNAHPRNLPDQTLNKLAGLLGDQLFPIRCSALGVLSKQRTLSEGILEEVAKLLEDKDSRVREAAAYALGDCVDPEDEILKVVTLRSRDFVLVENCVSVPGTQSASLKEILEMMLSEGFLEETLPTALREMFPQESAQPILTRELLEALAKPPLPEDILAAVAQRLDDKRSKVRKAAVHALGAHSILPGEILERVAKQLDDKSETVRESAARTLGVQSTLPAKILEAVAQRLDDKDSNVREATVYALGGQYNLPGEMLKAVANRLDDTESNVRQAVANILGFQPNFSRVTSLLYTSMAMRTVGEKFGKYFSCLPYDFLADVMTDFDDDDSQVKEAARSAWTYQSALPVEILTAMAERLNDGDRKTRKNIARALIGQSNLPGEIVTIVVALLKDGNLEVRDAAARVLGKQSVLSEEIGQALAVVMDDQKDREETIYTDTSSNTEDETSLSSGIVEKIPASLATEDGTTLSPAIEDETPLSPAIEDETPLSPAIEDETPLSPAIEDETPWSPATEDEASLSSDTDHDIAESLINKAAFPRDKIKEVDAAFREGYRTYHGKFGGGKWRSGLHYESWLSRSFHEQLVWYIEDGNLCLQYAEQFWKLAFKSDEKQDQFMAKLHQVRANLGTSRRLRH